MKSISRFAVSLLLIFVLLSNALPCGPGYVSPVFVNTGAPENPYTGFAAGRLGIVKKDFRRSLLYAVYRYVNGGGFTADEQKTLVEMWRSDIDRTYTQTDTISPVVKAWLEKRKDVVGKDEKVPEIYVERSYGGYDFFPNCTLNAFETAAETLAERSSAHGPNDPGVRDWVRAQDDVFANCSSGKKTPDDAPVGAPDWLQKDRAYQKAAAAFYALDYPDAKRRFAEIAQDNDSPWRETADYLVGRTLIRQASLTKSQKAADALYQEAEQTLSRFASGNGKFAASAKRMYGLVQYRLHPKERVSELAKILSMQNGNDNFKQDLIDYTWLLDKFENETLTAESKRKQQEEAAKTGTDDNTIRARIEQAVGPFGGNIKVEVNDGEATLSGDVAEDKIAAVVQAATAAKAKKVTNNLNKPDNGDGEPEMLQINLYSDDFAQNWVVNVKPDATDDDAIAAAERVVGKALNEDMKKRVREMRQSAYAERFGKNRQPEYEGGYSEGESELTPELIPTFLAQDDLTYWLFIFQMKDVNSYDISFRRFRENHSDLWLMTALTKASADSPGVKDLIDAAEQSNRQSPAYMTIQYNAARLLLDMKKNAEARKVIEPILTGGGDDISISVRNQFTNLRLRLAQTLDDYLTDSLRRPYGYDFNGTVGSVDELIAEQKSYYDPEYNKDGREAFDREIDERFKDEKLWQDRLLFDSETIAMMNASFSNAVMMQVEQSTALPEYLRSRFAVAIWTRAYLLEDWATLAKESSVIAKYEPEYADQLKLINEAKTPAARQSAALYFVLKNPLFSPFIVDGLGRTDNEFGQWDDNDWWCSSYLADSDTSESPEPGVPVAIKPTFLTAAQKQAAAAERAKIIALGDAPALLAKRVVAWATRSPKDPRVPESLYIVHQANGWTKYGCGNSEETQKLISDLMNKTYPQSEWTRKLTEETEEK